mmetsp:Transcript_18140/g.49768  ORF Transcript_18140/g.49768 Transcript_18140/m.49768 type:complete len:268 (+) Transcript_18140:86-889(+)
MAAMAGALLAGAVALSLQGCEVNIPRHVIGNWESKTNYLHAYHFTPSGANGPPMQLNSCSSPSIPLTLRCSGQGQCKEWFDNVDGGFANHQLSFCQCDTYWADPECRTQRKSQLVAFLLSVFLGVFGADQFYLGYYMFGTMKLFSLGGAGIWYVFDIVRIGSSPVITASKFKTANDLNHFAFVLTVIGLMAFSGFFLSIRSIKQQRVEKTRELMMFQAEIPSDDLVRAALPPGPGLYGSRQRINIGSNAFHGYGTTLAGEPVASRGA